MRYTVSWLNGQYDCVILHSFMDSVIACAAMIDKALGRLPRDLLNREFCIDNLLVQIHFIIEMIRWTGLAPWGLKSPFLGGLTSTSLSILDVYGV